MASFVTLEREEYDDLIRDSVQLGEMMTTLDLILDALKEHMIIEKGEVLLETFVDLEEIRAILEYRHPEAWRVLEKQVKEAEAARLND
jgi:hypothetical protein